jgi:hypothetical protein
MTAQAAEEYEWIERRLAAARDLEKNPVWRELIAARLKKESEECLDGLRNRGTAAAVRETFLEASLRFDAVGRLLAEEIGRLEKRREELNGWPR